MAPIDTDALQARFDRPRKNRSRRKDRRRNTPRTRSHTNPTREGPTREGTVVGLGRGRASVLVDGEVLDCAVDLQTRRRQKTALAVGDRVDLAGDPPVLQRVAPRRTALSRPDPQNPNIERLIVANVDRVVIVAAIVDPPLRPRLVDRYLIAIWRGGAQPVLALNKLDLVGDRPEDRDASLAPAAPYAALGVPVIPCSADTGEGIDALRGALAGHVAAFVGHSGVGKSSLVNALGGRADTGSVAAFHGRGRHTTTNSTLHDLGDGIRVIDTPGIRAFGLGRLSDADLRRGFPEFDAHADGCPWSDCRHADEPGCAVRASAEAGSIAPARYDSYRRLLVDPDR